MSAKNNNTMVIKYALNCCSNVDNPYIFEDVVQGKKMYIGTVVKKRPKVGKNFSFYGLDIKQPSYDFISDITFETPIKEVESLSKNSHNQPIYYVSTDEQSAIIYVLSKDIISRRFDNLFLVHFYATLSKNIAFNFDYLSKNNMLTILHYRDIYGLIGNNIVYSPIRNGEIDVSINIKTPTIKTIIPIPYASNIYVVTFNRGVFPKKYIVLYNNSCSFNHTRTSLAKHNGQYCMLCGCHHEGVQWHHIIPRSLNGKNEYYNGSLLCPDCHKFIHLCQENYPNMFKKLTDRIIYNKPRIRLIYSKMKRNVDRITF